MESWNQAILLAKFELRNSKKALVLLSLLLIPYAFFIIYSTPMYLETGFVLYDPFFLIIIGVAALWARPKEFQLKRAGNNSWVNPYFIMLHQLPISREILIKNRFVIYYAYAVPLHTLFFMSIYIFSETMRTTLTFPQYVAFALIWISFGLYWGSIYPVTDLGEAPTSSNFKTYLYSILFIIVVCGGLFLLHVYTGYGVVYWTMIAAKKWPLLSSIASMIAAYIGTILALRQANKKIKEIDYSI
ncbi:hypothetical protein FITA111629_13455 [Filibacter tadaridae]|uniref:ABC-2 family transporter protein n=1 Tax=Filibacter tadaridae TaxID=2483811 RepID=A0A3P5WSH0_9BACL|nr:hypothetical protein [Filibacter tadaridae]VDC24152.1 hypothetical protein FILTAD_01002 [Filibacter tadaridae]